MIPRSSDVADSLHVVQHSLAVAPWKIVLTYSIASLLWIAATTAVIESLTLPEWAYSMRALVFMLFTTVSMWLFTSRLTREAIGMHRVLGEAEKGYRALFEAHPAPMWLYDPQSLLIVRSNQAAVTVYGYSEVAFTQLRIIDLYAPDERVRLERLMQRSSLSHDELGGIHKHISQHQRILDVDVLCHTCMFNGQPYGLVMAQDISAHFTIEKKLRQSLRQLELAQQVAMLGYWEYDLATGRVACSPEIHSILGFKRKHDELPRERYLQAIHPGDRAILLRSQRHALRHGQSTHRYRVRRSNGEIRYVFERVLLAIDQSSRKKTLFGTSMDITELELAERRLASQQRLYERMVDSLPDGVLVVHEGRIGYANAAARSMLAGDPAHDLDALEFAERIHADHRAREMDRLRALQQGLISEQPPRAITMLRLDGSAFEVELTEILLENDGSQDVQLLVRDVSQAHRMHRALEDANRRLQHLSQRLIEVQELERRQLARDLHDDVGQQLTGLKLHLLRLGRTREDDAELAALTATLAQGADEALAKIRSLSLSLHPLQLETLGLEAAVRWHLTHFLGATQSRWELVVEGLPDDLEPDKAVAAFRIVQEAVNNVARHARADNVRVLLSQLDGGLQVEILDDGSGFDLAHATRNAQSLGLTSMQERVASLGGQLKISSLPGVGTRITAQLPAACGPDRHRKLPYETSSPDR
jgi:PAS domain S-box-containing protein